MRKITHLLTLLLMMLSIHSIAQVENFESTAVGDIPNGWTKYQSQSDDPGFVVQDHPGYAYEGTHYLVHEGVDIAAESTSWVVSYSMHVGTGYEMRFVWRGRWSNAYNYTGVFISTTSNDPVANPGDFTELKEFSPANYPNTWLHWNKEVFDMSSYANQNIYIAFKYVGDHAHDFFVDQVEIAPMPYCEAPQNLAVTDRGTDYIDVNWTDVMGTYEYEVVWGAPGFDPTTATNTMLTTANAAHITGLAQETSYDIYVRTNCSSHNHSLWTGPVSATTMGPPPANDDCTNAINLTVYDNGASAGNETNANTINATDSNMHPSCDDIGVNLDIWYTFTVPAGENSVYMLTGGNQGDLIEAALYDSCGGTEIDCQGQGNIKQFIGLTAGQTYTLQVWHDENNAGPFNIAIEKTPPPPSCGDTFYDDGGQNGDYSSNMNYSITLMPDNPGDLVTVTFNSFDMEEGYDSVMIYDGVDTSAPIFDSGSTFNRPTCPNGAWTGEPTDPYSANGQSFTATNAAGALTLVFASDGNIQHAGWEATLTCAPPPSCPAPSHLSASNILTDQADLSWNQLGNVTTWNIEYGIAGFTQGSGTLITGVTSNPYTLTGLSANTTYDFYVQADCGGGNNSTWAGPQTFTTPPGCGDIFYDDGGPNGDYSSNLNKTYTLYPANAGDAVTVTFNSFDMEEGYDSVMIYDGEDTSAPIFDSGSTFDRPTCPNGAWTGEPTDTYSANGQSYTATNAAGALTLVFVSDGSIQHAGWEATITCAPNALDNHQIEGFAFYPNPIDHSLNMTAAKNIESVSIYSIAGQEVIRTKPESTQTQIDMSRLKKGIYFVKAKINGELTAFKVVKK